MGWSWAAYLVEGGTRTEDRSEPEEGGHLGEGEDSQQALGSGLRMRGRGVGRGASSQRREGGGAGSALRPSRSQHM